MGLQKANEKHTLLDLLHTGDHFWDRVTPEITTGRLGLAVGALVEAAAVLEKILVKMKQHTTEAQAPTRGRAGVCSR